MVLTSILFFKTKDVSNIATYATTLEKLEALIVGQTCPTQKYREPGILLQQKELKDQASLHLRHSVPVRLV